MHPQKKHSVFIPLTDFLDPMLVEGTLQDFVVLHEFPIKLCTEVDLGHRDICRGGGRR